MKELSIKEKAKAYDEAMKAAVVAHKDEDRHLKATLERIFPELIESEDERVRKELLSFFTERAKYTEDSTFNGLSSKEIISWLEKKGDYHKGFRDGYNSGIHEEKPLKWTKHDELVRKEAISCLKHWKNCIPTTWNEDYKNILMWLENELSVHTEKQSDKPQGKSALEAINEEKVDNANKVEPRQEKLTKFEKAVKQVMEEAIECGDTHNLKADADMLLSLIQKPAEEYNITGIRSTHAKGKLGEMIKNLKSVKEMKVEPKFKDGDVLNSPSHHLIWIYRDNEHYYACLNMNYVTKNVAIGGLIKIPSDARPATKDERTILFRKLKKFGYEWDKEKKQLKTKVIHKKLTEFEKAVKQVMEKAIGCGDTRSLKDDAEMLLSLVHNSSWSEEDEKLLDKVIKRLHKYSAEDEEYLDKYYWLKELKHRVQPQSTWKPSDEQMDALRYVTNFDYGGYKATLVSLYEQLKKLRGE